MVTFIESVDLAGKTVLPFVYAVSGMSGDDDDYRDTLPDSDVRDGLAIQGETVTEGAADLEAWLTANDKSYLIEPLVTPEMTQRWEKM